MKVIGKRPLVIDREEVEALNTALGYTAGISAEFWDGFLVMVMQPIRSLANGLDTGVVDVAIDGIDYIEGHCDPEFGEVIDLEVKLSSQRAITFHVTQGDKKILTGHFDTSVV